MLSWSIKKPYLYGIIMVLVYLVVFSGMIILLNYVAPDMHTGLVRLISSIVSFIVFWPFARKSISRDAYKKEVSSKIIKTIIFFGGLALVAAGLSWLRSKTGLFLPITLGIIIYTVIFLGYVISDIISDSDEDKKNGSAQTSYGSGTLEFLIYYLVPYIIPALVLIIIGVVNYPFKDTGAPWYAVMFFLFALFVEGIVEEVVYHMLLGESVLVRNVDKLSRAVFNVSLIATVASVIVWRFIFKVAISPKLVIFLFLGEIFFALLYFQTMKIKQSVIARFIFKLIFLSGAAIYGGTHMMFTEWNGLIVFNILYLILFILVKITWGPENVIEKQRKKINEKYEEELDLSEDISGVATKRKKKSEKSVWDKVINREEMSKKDSTIIYILLSLILGAVLTGVHYFINYYYEPIGEIAFVREYGVELLLAQLNVTFLIISFLSFLSARDDYILWEDTMGYKLISPKLINFISLSVYAFSAMFMASVFFFLKWDEMTLFCCVYGFAVLTYLTFKMVRIFFNRGGLREELRMNYCQVKIDKKKDMLQRLEQNTYRVLQNNDAPKIEENFSFLACLYRIYSLEEKEFVVEEIRKTIEHKGDCSLISLADASYRLCKNKHEDNDKILSQMIGEIESEITYIVEELANNNDRLLLRIIKEYGAELMKIYDVRNIFESLYNDSWISGNKKSMMNKFYDDVLIKYIDDLNTSAEKIGIITNEENDENNKKIGIQALWSNVLNSKNEAVNIKYIELMTNYLSEYKNCRLFIEKLEESGIKEVENKRANVIRKIMTEEKRLLNFKNRYEEILWK